MDEFNKQKVKIELEVIESEMDKLDDWETNFITSVSDQFTNKGYLTVRQQESLHKIYNKVV